MPPSIRRLGLLFPLMLSFLSPAGAEETLPQPLTLEAALARADAPAPELALAASGRKAAEAVREEAGSRTRLRLDLEGRLRLGEPLGTGYSRNDSAATLVARRRLTDFGRTRAALDAGDAEARAAALRYRWARWQRRLDILDAYLDVLLADRKFRIADERMAILFVRLDARRDRHRLGQISDVDLLELESRYQQARVARMQAEADQRLSRARLAELLGVPGELPAELSPVPTLDRTRFELPPLDRLENEVLARHPGLQGLVAELEAAERRVAEAAAGNRPDLFFEAGAGDYARGFGSRNRWHAGLVLSVPLATGGRRDAALARARAERDEVRARLEILRRQLRLELRRLVEEIGIQLARREAADVRLEYRDLYLERSRALYELEVETDLGDAMVELNDALREQEEADQALLRARAQLDAMLDRPPLAEVLE